jgi:hypothetical protein
MYDPNLSEDEAKEKLISIQQSKLEMASMFTDPSKVFNGAQVAAIVDVSSKVGTGEISAEAGVNILITSFGIPEEQARSMVSETNGIKEKEDTKEDEEEDKLEYKVNNANKPR